MKIPYIELNDGQKIPQIGLGLWKVILPNQVDRAVHAAIESGYTHFDTAQAYGNEAFLRRSLAKHGLKREDTYITTKIWNGNQPEGRLEKSFDRSLKRLKTDYVDLLLLHFPVSGTRQRAWELLEGLHLSGRARSIGVSNYTVKHLEQLLATCKIKPAVNQVEIHVFLQQPELITFCKKHGIVVEAYSPLAHGHGINDPVISAIANEKGKSNAQIMIRWCVQQGLVTLPKSTHPDRISQNADVFSFELDGDDMGLLAGLERGLRTCWDPTNII